MMEWMDKYRDVPRVPTYSAIDKPLLIFLGLTATDLIAGSVFFIIVMVSWESTFASLVALLGSVASAWLARNARHRLPNHFFQHFFWSLGLAGAKECPRIFKRRRFVIFGP
jgi:hypothetical protein